VQRRLTIEAAISPSSLAPAAAPVHHPRISGHRLNAPDRPRLNRPGVPPVRFPRRPGGT
jgi:hypothetical protein